MPRITAIVSTQRGNTFDLRIFVRHGSGGGSTKVVATKVTSNGGQCSVRVSRNSCTIRGVRRGALLTVRIVSKTATTVLPGRTLRYRVGHDDWKLRSTTTTSSTTTLPASFAGRSYAVHSPVGSQSIALPLVVLLHGYGSYADLQETYMGLRLLSEERKFRLLLPDGTENPQQERFWNAGPICCDYFASGIDDETFLIDLVNHVSTRFAVDARRIYLIGHSNGGAMAYRLVCHHPGMFAAVASLAGIGQYDVSTCNRSSSVGSLHIHGTSDSVVLYNGGLRNGKPYVGARPMVERMVAANGCAPSAQENVGTLDLVADLSANETQVSRWTSCSRDVRTELWTIQNGSHVPMLSSQFSDLVYSFLAHHSK